MRKSLYNSTILSLPLIIFVCFSCGNSQPKEEKKAGNAAGQNEQATATSNRPPVQSDRKPIDTAAYNRIINELANGDTSGKWPVKGPYPLPGAVLPFNRIIAYYGNLYSKRMGALGEYPKEEMFGRLMGEVKKWQAADTTLPVIPALHYICVTAQGAPGKDGKYRARMPFHQIDTIVNWAKEINALVFLDIQVGHSTLDAEVPVIEKYLSMPNVNLGIDPEFSMKGGQRPGAVIGTYNAEDINGVIDYLAGVVRKYNLPPKILVVHRFTNPMVRGYERIKKVPEVQIVMHMDGWGDKVLKKSSYILYEWRDPVQFTGFKIFYKNDIRKNPNDLYMPEEVLKFTPKPIYIQYQ